MACYLYPHFTREMLLSDMAFYSGPCPGEEMPDFGLLTTTGAFITKSDFAGKQPLLLAFASITDSMTGATVPLLRRLHHEFGRRVAFVSLYVREAHPGERFPQPTTFDQKAKNAGAYARLFGIPWTVAIDSLDGCLHNALDPKTNAVYLMRTDGKIAFRSLWSDNENALRKALTTLLIRPQAIIGQNERRLAPLLTGLGDMLQALRLAGHSAERDFRLAAPPAYLAARVADRLPLCPLGRGAAGLIISILAHLLPVYGLYRLAKIHRGSCSG
ncbi:MAG TPA: deiodinase-related protein [Armatimonadota bacterium]|nr:deiodinase-related protein [Armatimonadota bacterium]